MSDSVSDFLVVANASAGTHEQQSLDEAVSVLEQAGEVDVRSTSRPDELDAVLGDLDGRVVVVAGGDGSLHAVVNALARGKLLGDTQLGLVPLGTGNDFARGADIPLDPAEAARLIAQGSSTPIDLIRGDDDTWTINNLHLGVGAQASRQAERWKPRLGRVGYVVGAFLAGFKPDFIRATVTVDGHDLAPKQRVAQVAIGNGPRVGGGTELLPGAQLDSRQLLVVVSRTVSVPTRLAYVARLRTGSHHYMKEVSRVWAETVAVRGADDRDIFWVSADGEISGPFQHQRWEIQRSALRMFLPGH